MARWEQYNFYPEDGVKWLKPSYNPTGLLVREILEYFKAKKSKKSIN